MSLLIRVAKLFVLHHQKALTSLAFVHYLEVFVLFPHPASAHRMQLKLILREKHKEPQIKDNQFKAKMTIYHQSHPSLSTLFIESNLILTEWFNIIDLQA